MRFLVPRTDDERAHRVDVLTRAVDDPAARAEIDSGKLAEPFCYTESPLTTPTHRFPQFPTEPGGARPPVPGVLCPDARLDRGERLRELVGPGFVVLTHWCGWRPADEWERAVAGRPVALDEEEDDHSRRRWPAAALGRDRAPGRAPRGRARRARGRSDRSAGQRGPASRGGLGIGAGGNLINGPRV